MKPDTVNERDLIDFVVHEARILDEQKFEDWNALFMDDAYYWIPLVPGQTDVVTQTSHMHADKLMRDLRIQRLRNPRVLQHQSNTRCQHILQVPFVEKMDASANQFVTRTPFHYAEVQTDYAEVQTLVGTAWHHLTVADDKLKITLKRVDLLNCDSPLSVFNLFV